MVAESRYVVGVQLVAFGAVLAARGVGGPVARGFGQQRRVAQQGHAALRARGAIAPVVPHRRGIQEIPAPYLEKRAFVHIVSIVHSRGATHRHGVYNPLALVGGGLNVHEAAKHGVIIGVHQNRVGRGTAQCGTEAVVSHLAEARPGNPQAQHGL